MASSNSSSPTPNFIANATLCYCAFVFMALILLSSTDIRGKRMSPGRPCDEIYVVGEGETLHTISDKCGDPFIVEENPHIQDPDDVFPGLVIKITPFFESRKLLRW